MKADNEKTFSLNNYAEQKLHVFQNFTSIILSRTKLTSRLVGATARVNRDRLCNLCSRKGYGNIMKEITKDMLIGDILDADRGTAMFFFEMGMHCLGCPSSRGESVEEACAVHGVDADELVSRVNEYLASK